MKPPPAHHLIIGVKAEQIALEYLESMGLQLVERNFRSPYGEIDLILRDKEMLVFAEVRYRDTDRYGDGADSITLSKRNRIIRTAKHFLATRKQDDCICRFDVVSASNSGDSGMQINWIKDAFEE
jgi:putative endonuclease